MIRRWVCYLLALLGALTFYTCYSGWVSWYLLMLTALLPWLSLLVSLPSMLRLRVRWKWQFSARCDRGAEAVLRLGRKSGWIPSPRRCVTLEVCHIGSGQRGAWQLWLNRQNAVPLDTSHCGVLRCRMRHGWVYDVLGLFRLPCRLPELQELTVMPLQAEPEPKPNLSPLQSLRWEPKSGGEAERHELRDYRPGDPMRSVHWKLSAKTDELIVRQPQEPVRRTVLVTLDLVNDPAAMDRILDRLCWLTDWLLRHDIRHEVRYLEPGSGALCRRAMESAADMDALLDAILHTPLTAGTASLADRAFPEADWRYHITAGEEAAS